MSEVRKMQPTESLSHDTGKNLVVISGPSGTGKTTVARALAGRLDLVVSTSATTRPCRAGEKDGVDYTFLGREAFRERVAAHRFVEWAEVFGHYYGTPVEELERANREGKVLLLEIDVQGGIQIKKKFPEALAILLLPPDDETLRRRLASRGTEAAEDFERRIAKAQEEIRMARASKRYDAEVVNDDLEAAIGDVGSRIQGWRRRA